MKNLRCVIVGGSFAVIVGVAQAAGPTSTLYLTAGDQHHNFEVLASTTNAIVSSQVETAEGGEYAIAVSGGSIRTGGNGDYNTVPHQGSTYSLNFAYVGPRLANVFNNVVDGTTDGAYNYGIDWQTHQVFRYNLDWSSPTYMFTAAAVIDISTGVSYDPFNMSLWVTDSNGSLDDYSLTGLLLSSFSTPGSLNRTLAFDPADGTLWSMTGQETGVFNQYNTSGSLLQTINIGSSDNIIGAEFAMSVPESSMVSLTGFGLLALSLHRVITRKQT